MLTTFTWADVAEHNTRKSSWLVIEKNVYDVTKFLEEHPGGEEVMLENAGFDATDAFDEIGHSDDAKDLLKSMLIGTLEDSAKPPNKHSKVAETTNIKTSGTRVSSGEINWFAIAAVPIFAAAVYFLFAK
ncbi:cytochrome b5-like heme/steroid binding domain-containing protein [Chytriomyces sp. MP71]|nr:cytochrome b5-like heme/steroid binding domain-containing protein [Chytriomyces sp. MP71]